jgi:hypothetical protein
MISIQLSEVVDQIVSDLLLGQGRQHEAMYFCFDVRLTTYDGGRTLSQSRGLCLLYHQEPGASVVSVFSAVLPDPRHYFSDVPKWMHETSHDICWRNVAALSRVYFDMARHLNRERVLLGMEEVAPIEMTGTTYFFRKLFRWVPVSITREPGGYERTVKVL